MITQTLVARLNSVRARYRQFQREQHELMAELARARSQARREENDLISGRLAEDLRRVAHAGASLREAEQTMLH